MSVDGDWFARTFVYAYGDGSDEEEDEYERLKAHFRDLLDNVAIIEVAVKYRDTRFSIQGFTQLEPFPSSEFRQAAYLEQYLNEDGTERVPGVSRYLPDPPEGNLRVVFFMHCWNLVAPLETPYGPVLCPNPTIIPERLRGIVEYEPID